LSKFLPTSEAKKWSGRANAKSRAPRGSRQEDRLDNPHGARAAPSKQQGRIMFATKIIIMLFMWQAVTAVNSSGDLST
jgi:hypothetical protein